MSLWKSDVDIYKMRIIVSLWMSTQMIPKNKWLPIKVVESFKQDMFESANKLELLLLKILHKKTSTDAKIFCSDHVSVMFRWL